MRELHRYYFEVRELEFEVFGEWLPTPGTRVTLSKDVKDRWGLPAAHRVAPRRGGEGAARDACDLLLHAQGRVDAILEHGEHP